MNHHKGHLSPTDTSGSTIVRLFEIKGLCCVSCAEEIERQIRSLPGVTDVQVNFKADSASVEFTDQETGQRDIEQLIGAFG